MSITLKWKPKLTLHNLTELVFPELLAFIVHVDIHPICQEHRVLTNSQSPFNSLTLISFILHKIILQSESKQWLTNQPTSLEAVMQSWKSKVRVLASDLSYGDMTFQFAFFLASWHQHTSLLKDEWQIYLIISKVKKQSCWTWMFMLDLYHRAFFCMM